VSVTLDFHSEKSCFPTMPWWTAFPLFVRTTAAEIVGCWLPWRVLRLGASPWWLLPAALALALFAWLLTLHPQVAGRTYAAYGGVYVASALVWLWLVEGQRPDRWDLLGAGLILAGSLDMVASHWSRAP